MCVCVHSVEDKALTMISEVVSGCEAGEFSSFLQRQVCVCVCLCVCACIIQCMQSLCVCVFVCVSLHNSMHAEFVCVCVCVLA